MAARLPAVRTSVMEASAKRASALRASVVEAVTAPGTSDAMRQSLVADGLPMYHSEQSESSCMERTRAACQRLAAAARSLGPGGTFGSVGLVALTVGTLLLYHLLSKVIFGGRPKDEQPSKFFLIALTRAVTAVLYWAVSRLGLGSKELRGHLGRWQVWLLCLPYSVGILGVYVTSMMSLEFIALSARNAVMQGRLLLDLLIGNFLLGVRITPTKLAGVCAIISAVITSMFTVKQSAMSKDPLQGMILVLTNNAIASMTYAYFPVMLRWFKVPPTVCSLVCALEALSLCVLGGLVEARGVIGSALVGGFRSVDAVLVLAISLTDTCYFFVPIFLPPIVLTLCVTSTIPSGYFLESLYFGMPVEPLTAVSMLTVGLSTVAYAVSANATAAPSSARDDSPTDVGTCKDLCSDDGRGSYAGSDFGWGAGSPERRGSQTSGRASQSSGGGEPLTAVCPAQCSCLETAMGNTGDEDVLSCRDWDTMSWDRFAEQFQEEQERALELCAGSGVQPVLLGQRGQADPNGERQKESLFSL